MKKILLTLTLVLCGVWIASAQNPTTDVEKKIQNRVAFMKEHLKLNATEAKTFWAEYEKYLRSEINYHETFRKNLESKKIKYDPRNKESIESVSSDQITYMMDQKMELKKNLSALEASFYKKIKTILTPRHLFDFYTYDEQFKRNAIAQKSKAATPQKTTSKGSDAPAQSKPKR
jgi:lipopolysaccharide export LptBFGC system permease protein LptF